jgi:hypothetical protein
MNGMGSTNRTFNSYDQRILDILPPQLRLEFPAMITHRSAIDDTVFALMRTCFQNGMGAKQFSDALRTLHIRRFDHLQIQFYEMALSESVMRSPSDIKAWSSFEDRDGYAGFTPSAPWLRDLYDDFIGHERALMDQYTALQPCRVLAIDHSHKV